ncbi:MAG: ABC transporter permease [Firmicutes bacterium]|nr:ABC transporter permease [Bacillota bacterium]MCL5040005.1 ABC transporter permease [Bacillota bacterium]
MDIIWQGLQKAARLLLAGDAEVWRVTFLTLQVSGGATLISLLIGLPLGAVLALKVFPGRRVAVSLVNTGMALPPVVVGLVVSVFLWRNGPFGFLHLMYTPTAMVIAQSIIATPLVTGVAMAGLQQLDPRLNRQILALGASGVQTFWLLLREARLSILAAVMAGLGGVISEVGASMMVGGNVQGQTRVLTTATVMEVSKGNFDVAMALSIILLLLTYGITLGITMAQQRKRIS